MKKQCERILDYMKKFGGITTLDAFTDLGITRLGSRIHDLRSDGIRIKGEYVTSTNRFGEKVHYMKYTLEE